MLARSRSALPWPLPRKLRTVLESLIRPPRSTRKAKVTWLLPQIEAEVSYTNVTAGGMLRQGILKGLRYDLKA